MRLTAVKAVEDRHAVEVRILACENRRATGRADRISHEAVREAHPVFGNSINVRRAIYLTAVSADGMRSVIVRHDEDDIGSLLRFLRGCRLRLRESDKREDRTEAEEYLNGSPDLLK